MQLKTDSRTSAAFERRPQLEQAALLFCPSLGRPDDPEEASETPQSVDYSFPPPFGALKELNLIVQQLAALAAAEPEDEDGVLRPTMRALQRTNKILLDASTVFLLSWRGSDSQLVFPKGFVSTDNEGGIRIEWMWPNSSVRLIVPATTDGKEYIYFEFGEQRGSHRRVDGALLARLLKQLN